MCPPAGNIAPNLYCLCYRENENGARRRTSICTGRRIFLPGVTGILTTDEGMALIAYGRFREEEYHSSTGSWQSVRTMRWRLLGKATALDRIGLFAAALPLIERALDLEPMNLDAWFLQGSIFHRRGDLSAAVQCILHYSTGTRNTWKHGSSWATATSICRIIRELSSATNRSWPSTTGTPKPGITKA